MKNTDIDFKDLAIGFSEDSMAQLMSLVADLGLELSETLKVF